MEFQDRLIAILGEILPVQPEEDGAVTVHHDGTFASLRVVTIAEELDLISLTQVLAWDLPLDAKLRASVAEHAHNTLAGHRVAGGQERPRAGRRRRQAQLQESRGCLAALQLPRGGSHR